MAGGVLASPAPARALTAASARRLKLFNAHTRRKLRRALPRRHGTDRAGDGGAVAPAARPSFRRADRDRCRGARFRRGGDGRGRREPRDGAVGLPHGRDQPDAGAHDVRGRRQQPASLWPGPRHPPGERLEDAMETARTMQRGGVGWYPRSGFIHLDTGPVRNWTLDGMGFDGLLARVEQLLARSGMPKEVIAARAHRPLNVRQRLALHRVIAKAQPAATPRQYPTSRGAGEGLQVSSDRSRISSGGRAARSPTSPRASR